MRPLFRALVYLIGGIFVTAVVVRCMASYEENSSDAASKNASKRSALDLARSIYTQRDAIVCPGTLLVRATSDRREHGTMEAIDDAFLSFFGRSEKVVAAGCEEWQDGIRAYNVQQYSDVFYTFTTEPDASGPQFFTAGSHLRNDPHSLAPTVANVPASPSVAPGEEVPKLPPLRLQEDKPATLTGTYQTDVFDNCCENGQEKKQPYGEVRLGRAIVLYDPPPNANAENEYPIAAVELGGLTAVQRSSIGDGAPIFVTCSSLYEGNTGHYALHAYCKDARVNLMKAKLEGAQ